MQSPALWFSTLFFSCSKSALLLHLAVDVFSVHKKDAQNETFAIGTILHQSYWCHGKWLNMAC